MHSPPTVTNWCWRPTVTLLSLVVGADPYCHSDCLALRLCLSTDVCSILQLFLLFWNITCQTRLIQGPACSFLAQRRLEDTISWSYRHSHAQCWHRSFNCGKEAFLRCNNCTLPQKIPKQKGGKLQNEGVCRFTDKLRREVEEFCAQVSANRWQGTREEQKGRMGRTVGRREGANGERVSPRPQNRGC